MNDPTVDHLTPDQARVRADEIRNDPEHPFNRGALWDRDATVRAAEEVVRLETRAAQRAAPPLPPGPSAADLEEQFAKNLGDREGWASGRITPDSQVRLSNAMRERAAQEALAGPPAAPPVPPPFSQSFAKEDLERVLPREMVPADKARFTRAVEVTGSTYWEGSQLSSLIQMAAPRIQAADPLDLDELWGAEANANIRTMNAFLTKLRNHSAADHDEILPFVQRNADVLQHVLSVAKRQAHRPVWTG